MKRFLLTLTIISILLCGSFSIPTYANKDPYLPLATKGLYQIFDQVGNPIARYHLWNKDHFKIGGKDVYTYEFVVTYKVGNDTRIEALRELMTEKANDKNFSIFIKTLTNKMKKLSNKTGIDAYSSVGQTFKDIDVGIAIVNDGKNVKVMGFNPLNTIVLFPLKNYVITKDMWKARILKEYRLWQKKQIQMNNRYVSHSAIVSYADRYTNNTWKKCNSQTYMDSSYYNHAYNYFYCNDCANFVSQALHAGGLTTDYRWYPYSYAWVNVNGLIEYLFSTNHIQYTYNPVAGDIASYKSYAHVGVIAGVSGSYIYIDSHTSDRKHMLTYIGQWNVFDVH